jgi:hypothetical protein
MGEEGRSRSHLIKCLRRRMHNSTTRKAYAHDPRASTNLGHLFYAATDHLGVGAAGDGVLEPQGRACPPMHLAFRYLVPRPGRLCRRGRVGNVTGSEEWLGDRGGVAGSEGPLSNTSSCQCDGDAILSGMSRCPRLASEMVAGSGLPSFTGVACVLALESQDSGSEDSISESASDIVCCEF